MWKLAFPKWGEILPLPPRIQDEHGSAELTTGALLDAQLLFGRVGEAGVEEAFVTGLAAIGTLEQ